MTWLFVAAIWLLAGVAVAVVLYGIGRVHQGRRQLEVDRRAQRMRRRRVSEYRRGN